MPDIDDVNIKLGVDEEALDEGLDSSQSKLKTWAKGAITVVEDLSKTVTAIVAGMQGLQKWDEIFGTQHFDAVKSSILSLVDSTKTALGGITQSFSESSASVVAANEAAAASATTLGTTLGATAVATEAGLAGVAASATTAATSFDTIAASSATASATVVASSDAMTAASAATATSAAAAATAIEAEGVAAEGATLAFTEVATAAASTTIAFGALTAGAIIAASTIALVFAGIAIGATVAIPALISVVKSTTELINQQALLAAQTKSSFEQIATLQGAEKSVGAPSGTLTDLFSGNKIDEIINGINKIKISSGELGVALTDAGNNAELLGTHLSTSFSATRLLEISDIVDQFTKLTDPVDKAALAVKLFGDNAEKALPLMNENLKLAVANAYELSQGYDKATRESLERIQTFFDWVKNAIIGSTAEWQALWDGIKSGVVIAITSIEEKFHDLWSKLPTPPDWLKALLTYGTNQATQGLANNAFIEGLNATLQKSLGPQQTAAGASDLLNPGAYAAAQASIAKMVESYGDVTSQLSAAEVALRKFQDEFQKDPYSSILASQVQQQQNLVNGLKGEKESLDEITLAWKAYGDAETKLKIPDLTKEVIDLQVAFSTLKLSGLEDATQMAVAARNLDIGLAQVSLKTRGGKQGVDDEGNVTFTGPSIGGLAGLSKDIDAMGDAVPKLIDLLNNWKIDPAPINLVTTALDELRTGGDVANSSLSAFQKVEDDVTEHTRRFATTINSIDIGHSLDLANLTSDMHFLTGMGDEPAQAVIKIQADLKALANSFVGTIDILKSEGLIPTTQLAAIAKTAGDNFAQITANVGAGTATIHDQAVQYAFWQAAVEKVSNAQHGLIELQQTQINVNKTKLADEIHWAEIVGTDATAQIIALDKIVEHQKLLYDETHRFGDLYKSLYDDFSKAFDVLGKNIADNIIDAKSWHDVWQASIKDIAKLFLETLVGDAFKALHDAIEKSTGLFSTLSGAIVSVVSKASGGLTSALSHIPGLGGLANIGQGANAFAGQGADVQAVTLVNGKYVDATGIPVGPVGGPVEGLGSLPQGASEVGNISSSGNAAYTGQPSAPSGGGGLSSLSGLTSIAGLGVAVASGVTQGIQGAQMVHLLGEIEVSTRQTMAQLTGGIQTSLNTYLPNLLHMTDIWNELVSGHLSKIEDILWWGQINVNIANQSLGGGANPLGSADHTWAQKQQNASNSASNIATGGQPGYQQPVPPDVNTNPVDVHGYSSDRFTHPGGNPLRANQPALVTLVDQFGGYVLKPGETFGAPDPNSPAGQAANLKNLFPNQPGTNSFIDAIAGFTEFVKSTTDKQATQLTTNPFTAGGHPLQDPTTGTYNLLPQNLFGGTASSQQAEVISNYNKANAALKSAVTSYLNSSQYAADSVDKQTYVLDQFASQQVGITTAYDAALGQIKQYGWQDPTLMDAAAAARDAAQAALQTHRAQEIALDAASGPMASLDLKTADGQAAFLQRVQAQQAFIDADTAAQNKITADYQAAINAIPVEAGSPYQVAQMNALANERALQAQIDAAQKQFYQAHSDAVLTALAHQIGGDAALQQTAADSTTLTAQVTASNPLGLPVSLQAGIGPAPVLPKYSDAEINTKLQQASDAIDRYKASQIAVLQQQADAAQSAYDNTQAYISGNFTGIKSTLTGYGPLIPVMAQTGTAGYAASNQLDYNDPQYTQTGIPNWAQAAADKQQAINNQVYNTFAANAQTQIQLAAGLQNKFNQGQPLTPNEQQEFGSLSAGGGLRDLSTPAGLDNVQGDATAIAAYNRSHFIQTDAKTGVSYTQLAAVTPVSKYADSLVAGIQAGPQIDTAEWARQALPVLQDIKAILSNIANQQNFINSQNYQSYLSQLSQNLQGATTGGGLTTPPGGFGTISIPPVTTPIGIGLPITPIIPTAFPSTGIPSLVSNINPGGVASWNIMVNATNNYGRGIARSMASSFSEMGYRVR